ncbi:carboxypeptidase-like regulatory domain-containing protein [Pyxidicoccus sp. 3LFB2]
MRLIAPYVLCSLLMLFAVPVLAESEPPDTRPGTLIGTALDARTGKPVPDAIVMASSTSLETERSTRTDDKGQFRLPLLPPGSYTLKFDHFDYWAFEQRDIQLRPTRTVRVTVQLLKPLHIIHVK